MPPIIDHLSRHSTVKQRRASPLPLGEGKRGCFTARRITIQLSNSQASSPCFFAAPGTPSSLFSPPLKQRGDGAPSGATIVLSCRVPSRERGRLSARHRGVSPSGGRARFAGVIRLVDDQPSASSWRAARSGHRVEPRRRPSACLRGTPAGAASGPTHMTPHESALWRTER